MVSLTSRLMNAEHFLINKPFHVTIIIKNVLRGREKERDLIRAELGIIATILYSD